MTAQHNRKGGFGCLASCSCAQPAEDKHPIPDPSSMLCNLDQVSRCCVGQHTAQRASQHAQLKHTLLQDRRAACQHTTPTPELDPVKMLHCQSYTSELQAGFSAQPATNNQHITHSTGQDALSIPWTA